MSQRNASPENGTAPRVLWLEGERKGQVRRFELLTYTEETGQHRENTAGVLEACCCSHAGERRDGGEAGSL